MSGRAVRSRVVVQGRVQGVCFRDSTDEEARRAGVSGWVRNRRDGSVEAVFEGESDGVQALVAFCHRGSRWAKVERIEVVEEAPEGIGGFEVL